MKTPPTEVVVRFNLATGTIISPITNQVGEPFEEERLDKDAINEYGIHVEKMPPIARFSSVVCDKKPTGCIIITRADGSQFMLW